MNPRRTPPILDRIVTKLDMTDDCWLWRTTPCALGDEALAPPENRADPRAGRGAHLLTHRRPRPLPMKRCPIDQLVTAAASTLTARTEIRLGARAPHAPPLQSRARRRTGTAHRPTT